MKKVFLALTIFTVIASSCGSNSADTTLLPNPNDLNIGNIPYVYNSNYNKANIYIAREYGLAPSNTTLTVNYLVGGGINSNQPANTINQKGFNVTNITFNNFLYSSNPTLGDTIFNSLTFNNLQPSTGGRDGDTIEEIRQNALGSISAQDRTVTFNDYVNRTLSMPSEFGNISKVLPINTNQKLINGVLNQSALDLYVLSYDSNKNIQIATSTLKNNLLTYLNNYKMPNDAVNIKDAFCINIGINFDITTIPQVSNREALNACVLALKDYFSIDKWQINQPIIIADIYSVLLQLRQVQSVHKIDIYNIQGGNYSQYGYDIAGATLGGIIYPSLDPSCFEIKFPDTDIYGRVVTL
jgi:hypothetical protein